MARINVGTTGNVREAPEEKCRNSPVGSQRLNRLPSLAVCWQLLGLLDLWMNSTSLCLGLACESLPSWLASYEDTGHTGRNYFYRTGCFTSP